MSKKTRQEIFDFVWDEMTKQGKPSRDERSGRCLYRGYNGTKCVIGHMVADDKAALTVNHEVLEAALLHEPFKKSIEDFGVDLKNENMNFLVSLQTCHDEAAFDAGDFLINFHNRMNWLAEELNLKKRKTK